jgi:hypothetical protein
MDILDKFFKKFSYKFPKGYPDINDEQDMLMLEGILKEMGIELQETALTPSELVKVNAKTGVPRIDILRDKIINDEVLELDKGGTFIVANKQEVLAQLKDWTPEKKAITLIDKEGNKITTSKLKKTKDFGGGKGSGAGTAQTKVQESAQCLVTALAQQQGGVSESDLTSEKLKSVSKNIDANVSIEEIINFIETSPDWTTTLVNTANVLNDYLGGGLEFHRGSQFVDSIYQAWNTARKSANLGRIKDDKWNPADIWAVSPGVKSIEFKTNLEELNNQILSLFNDKKLVGISLKKQADPTPELSIPVQKEKSLQTLDNVKVSPNSKDVYLITSGGKELQLRTFNNNGTSFQGEIKGKAANQGKIGGGILKALLAKQGIPTTSAKKLASRVKSLSDDFVNEFIDLAKNYGKFDITPEELKSKNFDWLMSKYQGLDIAKALTDSPQDKVSKALTDIYNYAGSASSISSIYLKVS